MPRLGRPSTPMDVGARRRDALAARSSWLVATPAVSAPGADRRRCPVPPPDRACGSRLAVCPPARPGLPMEPRTVRVGSWTRPHGVVGTQRAEHRDRRAGNAGRQLTLLVLGNVAGAGLADGRPVRVGGGAATSVVRGRYLAAPSFPIICPDVVLMCVEGADSRERLDRPHTARWVSGSPGRGCSVMAQVYATRSELLARRARIRLAVQGRDC